MVELTNELLSSTLDTTFYQTALERTVHLVPDAEGGSIVIRHDDGLYHFEAAVEFDFDVLKSVTLSDDELGPRHTGRESEKVEIHDYEQRLDADKAEAFRRAGRLNDIRATLSVPLRMGEESVGYFNLDNFRSAGAFSGPDIEIAEAIAAQVSLALYRLFLERRLQQERQHYRHMAHHDTLTGLPNRRLFLDSLDRALEPASRRRSRLGLLYIDLDDFKCINDAYGHDAGDYVLVQTAARIQAAIRKGDLAARLGGDEFGVLLIDVRGVRDATTVAEKITASCSEPVAFGTQQLRVTPSIGAATYPDHARETEALLKLADSRMYQLKASMRPVPGPS
ncbi:MAG: diguanylate cyclase [Bacteroidetes bacterium]|nr:diguanylate cyclase [Bacteroidota bacterium]